MPSSPFRDRIKDVVLSVPLPRSRRQRAAEAQRYWTTNQGDRWRADTHLRGEIPGWEDVGRQHRAIFEQLALGAGSSLRPTRILEWGAGGGANAVAFAPGADEFIAVDVSPEALTACGREVAAVGEATYTPVLVGVDTPEDALTSVEPGIDLLLCLYVIELLPSRDHARRILEVGRQLLRPGGSALVQVKYQTGSLLTRPRTWSYHRQVASMTSFAIHEFWESAEKWGFRPEAVRLVPRNQLDERYAYYFLTRP